MATKRIPIKLILREQSSWYRRPLAEQGSYIKELNFLTHPDAKAATTEETPEGLWVRHPAYFDMLVPWASMTLYLADTVEVAETPAKPSVRKVGA